jgi:hypothetical protein
MLTFRNLLKNFNFSQKSYNHGHDGSEVPNETTIKLGHAIENLNVLGGFWF